MVGDAVMIGDLTSMLLIPPLASVFLIPLTFVLLVLPSRSCCLSLPCSSLSCSILPSHPCCLSWSRVCGHLLPVVTWPLLVRESHVVESQQEIITWPWHESMPSKETPQASPSWWWERDLITLTTAFVYFHHPSFWYSHAMSQRIFLHLLCLLFYHLKSPALAPSYSHRITEPQNHRTTVY